jgi:hypothetical protein
MAWCFAIWSLVNQWHRPGTNWFEPTAAWKPAARFVAVALSMALPSHLLLRARQRYALPAVDAKLAAAYVPKDTDVFFHSENVIVGMSPLPGEGFEDRN